MKRCGNWKKLTPEDVAEIRLRAATGEPKRALAAEYGVSEQTVGHHCHHGKLITARESEYAHNLELAANARRQHQDNAAAYWLVAAAKTLLNT